MAETFLMRLTRIFAEDFSLLKIQKLDQLENYTWLLDYKVFHDNDLLNFVIDQNAASNLTLAHGEFLTRKRNGIGNVSIVCSFKQFEDRIAVHLRQFEPAIAYAYQKLQQDELNPSYRSSQINLKVAFEQFAELVYTISDIEVFYMFLIQLYLFGWEIYVRP